MKAATLGLVYIFKFLELAMLSVWTVLTLMHSTIFLNHVATQIEKTNTDMQLLILVPFCMLLAVYNLFYNNLLINLRFRCKMCCVTVGMCLFDCINLLFCYCFLLAPCRD